MAEGKIKILDTKDVLIKDITIGESQARLRQVKEGIGELADTIRVQGLLHPILIQETELDGYKYEVIAGQRRLLACTSLGYTTIRAEICEKLPLQDAKIASVIENIARTQLNPRDMIDACTYLYYQYGSIQAVADEMGISRQVVSNNVKAAQLNPRLREMVDRGEVRLKTAIIAQEAALQEGTHVEDNSVLLAKELSPLPEAIGRRLAKNVKTLSEQKIDRPMVEIIEDAKRADDTVQIGVTLSGNLHRSLEAFANEEGSKVIDAAHNLIEEGLSAKGFGV